MILLLRVLTIEVQLETTEKPTKLASKAIIILYLIVIASAASTEIGKGQWIALAQKKLSNIVANNNTQALGPRSIICGSIHINQKISSIWWFPFSVIRPVSSIFGIQIKHRNKVIQPFNNIIYNPLRGKT